MKFITNNTIKRSSAFFLSLVISITSISASAQTQYQASEVNPVFDLVQAIDIALANNTQMKRALLSVKDADQQIRTSRSELLPEITASANYTRNLEVPVNFLPEVVFDPSGDPNTLVPIAFGTDNNWTGGFTATQTLFKGDALISLSTSDIYKVAQSENLRAVAQSIVTQTRVNYYQILIAKEQVRLAQAQVDRIQKNLDDAKKLYNEGFTDEYAVLQIEVQLANLAPQLTTSKFAVENSKREFLDVLGLPLTLNIKVKGNLNTYEIDAYAESTSENQSIKEIDELTPVQLEEDSSFTEQAFNLRGDLRVIGFQQQLQEKELKAAKSDYLPSLIATYNLQWTAAQPGTPVFFGTEDQRARSQTVMVGLQFPLFQGFRRDAAVQISKIQIKDLELQKLQTKRTASKEILASQQAIQEAYQNNNARKKALEQADIGYERALFRYKNGIGSQQEVTDADLQLRQAEINYAQMVFNYLSAKAQYDQALGRVPFVSTNVDTIKENIELK